MVVFLFPGLGFGLRGLGTLGVSARSINAVTELRRAKQNKRVEIA